MPQVPTHMKSQDPERTSLSCLMKLFCVVFYFQMCTNVSVYQLPCNLLPGCYWSKKLSIISVNMNPRGSFSPEHECFVGHFFVAVSERLFYHLHPKSTHSIYFLPDINAYKYRWGHTLLQPFVPANIIFIDCSFELAFQVSPLHNS